MSFSALVAAGAGIRERSETLLPPRPKSESWALSALATCSRLNASMRSTLASKCPRSSMASKAPTIMRASSDFLLRLRFFIRVRKSCREAKRPLVLRSSIIASLIPSPKFLIVVSPKRMVCLPGTTEKSANDSLISGGNTSIPIRSHSWMDSEILSTSPESAVSTADMYSTG